MPRPISVLAGHKVKLLVLSLTYPFIMYASVEIYRSDEISLIFRADIRSLAMQVLRLGRYQEMISVQCLLKC